MPARFSVWACLLVAKNNSMTYLNLEKLIGSGSERSCWEHPLQPTLCIKTLHSPGKRDQNRLDFQYYQVLKKYQKSRAHIPALVGWCDTDKGKGLVFERVINTNQQPSLNLQDSLEQKQITPEQACMLIEEMFSNFLDEGLSVYDEEPPNYLVRIAADHMKLMIVDGVGHRRIGLKSQLRDRFPVFSRRKMLAIRRHLLDFVAQYAKQTAELN